MKNLVAARMRAQRLNGRHHMSAVDLVRWFGAVQSQDYVGAKWALGLRFAGATNAQIDRLYDEGAILRTHVLRPTWHFVLPDDIRWMLQLTGPKIHQGMAGRYRQLELDPNTITRSHVAFAAALSGGRHMTRPELGDVLRAAGIAPDGQRLPHLLSSGELAGLLTSGPRHGRQHTYALLEERAPRARVLDRVAAIGELAGRYFRSHGPAQLQDFVWWSGLTLAEARRGIALAGDVLERQTVDGKEYWFDSAMRAGRALSSAAHLLPNFDEYTVGYTDRSAILHPVHPFRPELFAFSSILANVVTLGGHVCGAWHRSTSLQGVRIEVRPLARLASTERAAVGAAGNRLARFLECPVEVAWVTPD
jgi:winged helix DNA-binding protein